MLSRERSILVGLHGHGNPAVTYTYFIRTYCFPSTIKDGYFGVKQVKVLTTHHTATFMAGDTKMVVIVE